MRDGAVGTRGTKINRFAQRCNIHSMQILVYTDKSTSSVKLSFAQIFLCSLRRKFIASHGERARSRTHHYKEMLFGEFTWITRQPVSQSASAAPPPPTTTSENVNPERRTEVKRKDSQIESEWRERKLVGEVKGSEGAERKEQTKKC